MDNKEGNSPISPDRIEITEIAWSDDREPVNIFVPLRSGLQHLDYQTARIVTSVKNDGTLLATGFGHDGTSRTLEVNKESWKEIAPYDSTVEDKVSTAVINPMF